MLREIGSVSTVPFLHTVESEMESARNFSPPTTTPIVKFDSGAVRAPSVAGEGGIPLRYDLIPEGPLKRLAATYGEGALKYSDNNWKKGIPEGNLFNHLMAHLLEYRAGDRSEDHLAHAAWGIFSLMYFEDHPNAG